MGRLEALTLHNFKSYGGTQQVGPFSSFTAVIGPNGSGKSNIMDAISFVLGVKTQQLRGAQLKDLVYQSPVAADNANAAFVEMLYIEDDRNEKRFRRAITSGGAADYKVDGKRMSWKEYIQELEKINVLVKVRNFLVFQGDVESIAQKSPQEITQLVRL
jgi:structural maintenance of chromosome 1